MGVIFKTDKRRIIPRWRSLELTSVTGELENFSNNKSKSLPFNSTLTEQRKSWLEKKDLPHAGDLLSSAFVIGLENEFLDVAEFIVANTEKASSSLLKLANRVLKSTEDVPEQVEELANTSFIDKDIYSPQIRTFKNYLNKENRNPIAWIELGRLYSLVGEVKKAQKCVDAALFLDKNNRYIVRSASRFYHHFHGDKGIALQVIKKSDFLKSDPWLISAEIAYSSVLERHSKMAKIGVEYLKNKEYNSKAITELASAIGTLEFNNGKMKEARRYFNQSLLQPNDNSLAQASWMEENINGFELDVSKFHVPLAYEAKAHDFYEKGDYKNSLHFSLRWFNDEAYSTRPINLASYVAGTFLNNNRYAIDLLRKGLELNSDDPMLVNNLTYFLVEEDRLEEAIKIFSSSIKDINSMDESIKISVIATYGLLLYRTGEVEKGRDIYQRAISLAKKEKNDYLFALATANYVKEELRITNADTTALINQLNLACQSSLEPDVKIMYDRILRDYEKKAKDISIEAKIPEMVQNHPTTVPFHYLLPPLNTETKKQK
jgi:tetratricopeptide (TPR) repeat protein